MALRRRFGFPLPGCLPKLQRNEECFLNQTANYQLSQWESTDRILMADFNADNAKIDAALKANAEAITAEAEARNAAISAEESARLAQPTYTLLKTTTVTASGNDRTISLSGIDWDQYQEVVLLADLEGSGYGDLRIDGAEQESYVCLSESQFSGWGVARIYFNRPLWLRFLVGKDADRRFSSVALGAGVCYCLGFTPYSQITTLRLLGESEGDQADAGCPVTVWGIK